MSARSCNECSNSLFIARIRAVNTNPAMPWLVERIGAVFLYIEGRIRSSCRFPRRR